MIEAAIMVETQIYLQSQFQERLGRCVTEFGDLQIRLTNILLPITQKKHYMLKVTDEDCLGMWPGFLPVASLWRYIGHVQPRPRTQLII